MAVLLVGVAAGKDGSADVMIGGATADKDDGKVLIVGEPTAATTVAAAAAAAIMFAGNAGEDGKAAFE